MRHMTPTKLVNAIMQTLPTIAGGLCLTCAAALADPGSISIFDQDVAPGTTVVTLPAEPLCATPEAADRFCSARAAVMRLARTGPIPSISRSRSGLTRSRRTPSRRRRAGAFRVDRTHSPDHAEPHAGRALGCASDFVLTSSTAAVAAAAEVGGRLRQHPIATARPCTQGYLRPRGSTSS